MSLRVPWNKYMSKQLTDRAKQFCEEYVKTGYNARQAYKVVYWIEDDQVASSAAYNLLRDPRVKEEIDSVEGDFRLVWYKIGITKESMLKTLKEMMEARKVIGKNSDWEKEFTEDWTARFNAIRGIAMLFGESDKKKAVEPTEKEDESDDSKSIQLMSSKELAEYKKNLLKQL